MATAQSHRYRPSNELSSICLHAHAPGPRCDLGGCRCPGPHEKTRYDIIQIAASAQPGPGEPGSHANVHGLDRGRARSLPRCVAVRVGVRQPELPGVDGPRPSARHLPVRHDVGRRERLGRDLLGARARPHRRRSLQPAHPACSRNSVRRRSFRRRGVQQVVRFAHRQDDRPPTAHFIEGYGWSVTDLGRLLTWLRIIARSQPQFATQATTIVKRLNIERLISSGYLQGTDLDPQTGQLRVYPEGRMGYDQYAAAGLALWGFRAEKALDARLNALPVDVFGVSIIADKRGDERITSEPYIMMGMETGWYSPELREQAWRLLAAQEARYRATGMITMASEDALPDPPYYFYYYNIYRQGRPFTVDAQAATGYLDRPRWISSKAAFAWHALLPSSYTLAALQAVQGAVISGRGWGAGVYEGTLRPTGDASLNTAALILEAAVYNLRGHPFLATRLD